MVKTISFLMLLSSAAVFFTACSSQKEPSLEDRLHSQYGWNGTLPKPAADADAGKDFQEQTPAPVIVTIEQKSAAQTPEPVKKDDVKSDDTNDPIEKKLTKADLSGEKREHIIQKGESLWMLALKEYGDGIYWRWIYEENLDVIKGNPSRIVPGTKIKIPLLKKVVPATKPAPAPAKPTAKPAPVSTKPAAKPAPAPAKPAAKPAPVSAKPAAKPAPAPAKPAEVSAKSAAK